MADESTKKSEVNPKFARLVHAMMELVGALEHYPNPMDAVEGWTENERSQAFDYFRAIVRGLAPWFTAFRKAKKQSAGR